MPALRRFFNAADQFTYIMSNRTLLFCVFKYLPKQEMFTDHLFNSFFSIIFSWLKFSIISHTRDNFYLTYYGATDCAYLHYNFKGLMRNWCLMPNFLNLNNLMVQIKYCYIEHNIFSLKSSTFSVRYCGWQVMTMKPKCLTYLGL